MSIQENLLKIKQTIPDNVILIAVSKTKPAEEILQAYEIGQRVFGENKAQEMKEKYAILPKDIQWHMIGHLQENKVKYIVPFVSMIHSVDSLKILLAINKRALLCNRVVDCLFEMDISHEESKFGLSEQELESILSCQEYKQINNVRVCGLMGIGSITDDREQTRKEFNNLKNMFLTIKEKYFINENHFTQISMGMSSDYDLAIEEGSTMVRIGSDIFGARDYSKNKQ